MGRLYNSGKSSEAQGLPSIPPERGEVIDADRREVQLIVRDAVETFIAGIQFVELGEDLAPVKVFLQVDSECAPFVQSQNILLPC